MTRREQFLRDIRKVAVLGAGTMGARIAAHLANAGVPCVLLDMVPKELTPQEQAMGLALCDPQVRNRLAQAGLDAALKSRPAAFFVPEATRMITIGNFEDGLDQLSTCDWIIEAVAEDRAAKRALLEKVQGIRASQAIVSSNTSGISISCLSEGFSEGFRRHFLGTHFFNPPRYLRLLEIIPTQDTLPHVVEAVSRFGDVVLGKGIVLAKDTPNFIANRIGTFTTLNILRVMQEGGYTIEEIDALTGPALGMPKSATFRTLDIVGLDVLAQVVRNLRESLPQDERRGLFKIPDFIDQMIRRDLLGDKSGWGFYRKVKGPGADESEILTLNLSTLEYHPRKQVTFPGLDRARSTEDLRARVKTLFEGADRSGQFYRRILPDTFHYAAMRVPEISDDIVSIDNAMKWGFNWESGIFELWDAIGFERVVEDWVKQGRSLPPLVERLRATGGKSFYTQPDGVTHYFDLPSASYRPLADRPGVILLPALKARKKELKKNGGASLIDLGDGVLCLEFHSKMNTLGPDAVQMVQAGLKALDEDFDAMVIGNQAPNFCAGANLMLVLVAIQGSDWDGLQQAVCAFQNANMALKYAPKPVVAAPFGLALGGGTEISLHATRVRAAAESYMGLVEAGVGLIPAGGGTKEMLLRALEAVPADPDADPFTYVKEAFVTIGMAKVSSSAEEARKLRYLSPQDSIGMNRDRQIADAKQLALDLLRLGYRPGKPHEDIRALGQSAYSKMKLALHWMRRGEYLSDYDATVGTQLARVLSGGGEFTSPQRVSEQYLLDLEREAFLSLCGQRNTVERIQFTLKTGRPLRN
jgi:3-hydroxyacyl-CoA dehydrogenase